MKRLQMRKIRDAMRLHAIGLSTRKIAASLGVSQSTASEYLKRVEQAGLSWPLPDGLSDAALERRLFDPTGGETRVVRARIKRQAAGIGPNAAALVEVIRYGAGSTLITSQLPVDAWHDVIDEPTFADAILDRLVHNAYRLDLNGPSMRKMKNVEEPKSVDGDATN